MWWKNKVFLFSFCVHLILFSLSAFSGVVKAEGSSTEGFIIEADRVIGSGVSVGIISQETSASQGRPMLRFQYESATIYGMKLTKQVKNDKGAVSITLKAKGPVTVKDMIVDVTAISFKGVCLKAGETLPELGMENIVMVAHYMNSADSVIKNLLLNTDNDNTGIEEPGKLKILEELAMLPLNQLEKEIERITSENLPLTCEQSEETVGIGTDPINDVIKEVTNPIYPVLDPLQPVIEPIEPVLESLVPVLKPLDPVLEPIEPILKPLEPVMKPVDPVLKPLEPLLNPLSPTINPSTKPLEPVVGGVVEMEKTTCEKLSNGNGVITKELALELIDEAIEKRISLSSMCQDNTELMTTLQEWENSSLGLLDLLGKLNPINPTEQLYKMRAKIEKKADGTIVFGE